MPHTQAAAPLPAMIPYEVAPRVETRGPCGIAALAAAIEAACRADGVVEPGCVTAALTRAATDPGLLSSAQRATHAGGYARHVLHADPGGRFTILAIVWGAGQFSPAHAHDTWCAYAVHDNPLHETTFRLDTSGEHAEVLRTDVREPGYSCFAGAGLDQIHRLGNSGPRTAISIHVYGVPRERIATHVNRLVTVAT